MQIFISWSGEMSKQVASVLRDWLPSVIQAVTPWMSDEDLKKGARWSGSLAEQLEKTDLGICCLTPDNLDSPWLHFEAGALAKHVGAAHVCPYLFKVEPSDLEGPLREFQATRAEREDTKKLLATINGTLAKQGLSAAQLSKAFDLWWPDLENRLGTILAVYPAPKPRRGVPEMVEETLELVRGLARGQREAVTAAVEKYRANIMRQLTNRIKEAQAEIAEQNALGRAAARLAAKAPDLTELDEPSVRQKEPTD